MSDPLRIAVAASGSGTCFQSVIDNIKTGRLDAEVVQLITDNPGCKAVYRARENGIPVLAAEVPDLSGHLNKASGFKRRERNLAARVLHEDALLRGTKDTPGLIETAPEHLVMLGYMRILSEHFIGTCRREGISIWNTHPAPIPEYRGENGYAWGVGDDRQSVRRNSWHCVSFHDVTDSNFDTGRVLSCSPLEVRADDTEESLKARGMQKEYVQIRQCLEWISEGKVSEDGDKLVVGRNKGTDYQSAMNLHNYLSQRSNDRYSIVVSINAPEDWKLESRPVDAEVKVCYTPEGSGKPVIDDWNVLSQVPYNLAFTYARDAVESLRAEGVEASLMFDNMDIQPVIMKSDQEKLDRDTKEQGGNYDG